MQADASAFLTNGGRGGEARRQTGGGSGGRRGGPMRLGILLGGWPRGCVIRALYGRIAALVKARRLSRIISATRWRWSLYTKLQLHARIGSVNTVDKKTDCAGSSGVILLCAVYMSSPQCPGRLGCPGRHSFRVWAWPLHAAQHRLPVKYSRRGVRWLLQPLFERLPMAFKISIKLARNLLYVSLGAQPAWVKY